MKTTDFQIKTETKLKRIAWLSSRDKQKVFTNLMHLFNEESLEVCFNELDRRKAVGEDGVDKVQYGEQLEANLRSLIDKLKGMSYRPGPIRKVEIPKEGRAGERRPLGISNFEDKLVQTMMHKVLESIYEPLFYDCSYGFRPGRGCHDAVRALRQHLYDNEVETIIDIDLANFFGTIDHTKMLGILKDKIKDERLLRYVTRMLKAGILSNGELTLSDEGVAQGSTCSPIMSNIFAHVVLDEWFEQTVKVHCRGKVELVRYCDDAVICCQYNRDAVRIRKALTNRLAKYKLKLNEEKTKMVSFSKKGYVAQVKQGSFDFLGFTFYWGRSRQGRALPKLKSSGKRIRSKLKNVNEWARAVRNKYRLPELWKRFRLKLGGHIRYYGVSFNIQGVKRFIDRATRILFKWLNRRSQRKSFDWEKFREFIERNPLPRAKIWHTLC